MASISIQLQYSFFDEDQHSMDAFIRNENEKELLLIVKQVLSALDIELKIESEALREGSLENLWKLIGRDYKQITIVAAIVGAILTTPFHIVQYQSTSLDVEIKREELKKLKKEALTADTVQVKSLVDAAVTELQKDLKIQVHKSNFYRRLTPRYEIEKISTVQLDEKREPIGEKKTVYRNEFPQFVLKSNKLQPIIDEQAIIEIVSPVLKAGDYAWKGIYYNEVISFKMLDPIFKGSVLSKQTTFANGDSITCVLQQKREVDEVGVVKIVERNVLVVIKKNDRNEPSVITPQGEKYFRTKKDQASQLKIFDKPDQ